MLTSAPPSDRASLSPRRRVWPWAAGSILITLAVIAVTLVGHRLAAQARLAAEVAPAPALPPLAVNAIIHAPGQVSHLTLDQRTHTLVADVTGAICPAPTPTSAPCDTSAPQLTGVLFYDSVSGAKRGQRLTAPPSAGGPIALTDTLHGVTYLVGSSGVSILSDATGRQIGAYPSAIAASALAAGIDAQAGVIYTLDSKGALSAFTAADGQTLASVTLPPISQLPPAATPQIIVDASAGRVYVFAAGHNQSEPLFAYAAADLAPLGSWRVSADLEPGPFDAAAHTLYLRGDGGSVWRLDLTTLPAHGAGQTVTPQRDVALSGPTVAAFGWESATSARLLMNSAGVEAFASGATRPYALLPLVQAPEVSSWLLPMDASAGLAYLPGDDNTILIASLATPTNYAAPNAVTAALIARAGMAKLLPAPTQSPPFASARTFPLGAGAVERHYFIYYSDLGWKGPYAGTASVGDVMAGAAPGDYTMTFTIAWDQLFVRQHSWTVEVTPDGRTHLRAESGDGLP